MSRGRRNRAASLRGIGMLAGVTGVILAGSVAGAQEVDRRAERLFTQRIMGIFQSKCFACHGDERDDIRGDLDMHSSAGLRAGGETGEPAVVPGKPEESLLYLAVKWDGLEMPPKENDRLTEEQIEQIGQWITGGAPWPDAERMAELRREPEGEWDSADGVQVPTSGGLSDEWTSRRYAPEDLWAYQPLWTDREGWLRGKAGNPIDVFIDRGLAARNLDPAPPADRRVLIRRATYDLLGLPPTPEEIAAFVEDPADDDKAFERVVQRLLASPHYGEQWGRHWLDVVRYADSSGYANDYERGNAWRYRDYVVRVFNRDKPYDQFLREQIAGDEIDASDSELLVAVGFLRMGPWELTGMEVPRVARQRFLDDVTDAVGQVFLAHMLQCARCHDHKFDPVPTRDYYSLQAVFATTQLAERKADFAECENTEGFAERKYLQQRMKFYQQTLRDVNKKRTLEAGRAWLAEQGRDASAFEQAVEEFEKDRGAKKGPVTLDDVRNRMVQRDVHPDLIPPRHAGFAPRDFGMERVARKGIQRLKWRTERYEPFAFSVYDGRTPSFKSVYAPLRIPEKRLQAGELEATHILSGGDPFSPLEPVTPATLSVVSRGGDSASAGTTIPDEIENRRMALAEWIASEQNPLTARVMVNRVWQWHFGKAIAGNPNNFGATGKKPSHPELLDWLAARFMEDGWSIKSLHRRIMNSEAYRRSGRHPDAAKLTERDPLGTSYAAFRPRRLEAEELRDTMLFVSGELNPAVGGIPVRPEMNLEAALQPRQVMGTFAEAWQPSPEPGDRHRRSLYALRLRGQRDPFLEVFNSPTPDLSCEAREASTVTPQVFALFNSEATFDRALALADRLLGEALPPEATIDRLFERALGRSPTAQERRACLAHWRKMTARHEGRNFDPPVYPEQVVREAVEENTGERFTFVEPLECYVDFVPDLKPADVGPRVRGLAEVCLVLLNANEFAYVY